MLIKLYLLIFILLEINADKFLNIIELFLSGNNESIKLMWRVTLWKITQKLLKRVTLFLHFCKISYVWLKWKTTEFSYLYLHLTVRTQVFWVAVYEENLPSHRHVTGDGRSNFIAIVDHLWYYMKIIINIEYGDHFCGSMSKYLGSL